MTAREKAIEAAAEALAVSWDGPVPVDAEDRAVARVAVNAATPHIESALLDRIEAAVKGERLTDNTGEPDDLAYNRAVDDVLRVLTEIREGK